MALFVDYFSNLVLVLDRWVIVISLLTVAYLAANFRNFHRRYIVTSYILVLLLFIGASIRAIVLGPNRYQHPPSLFVLSFVLDIGVILYAASIIYHYEQHRDFGYVRRLLGLHRRGMDTVIEYGGPEVEGVKPGRIYMILERGHAYQWDLFDNLTRELPGICFTRKHPEKIDIDTEGRDVTFHWLTDGGTDAEYKTIEPFRRGEIEELIEEFVDDHKNPVILVEGLEYLIYKNSPDAVVDFVQHLNDALAQRRDVTMLYSLDESAIGEQPFALFKEEVDEVRIAHDEGNIESRQF